MVQTCPQLTWAGSSHSHWTACVPWHSTPLGSYYPEPHGGPEPMPWILVAWHFPGAELLLHRMEPALPGGAVAELPLAPRHCLQGHLVLLFPGSLATARGFATIHRAPGASWGLAACCPAFLLPCINYVTWINNKGEVGKGWALKLCTLVYSEHMHFIPGISHMSNKHSI